MEMAEITRLEELTSIKDANAYLALGWKLLTHYTTAYDTEPPRCNHQTAHYVMAWSGAEPKYPPAPEHPYLGLEL